MPLPGAFGGSLTSSSDGEPDGKAVFIDEESYERRSDGEPDGKAAVWVVAIVEHLTPQIASFCDTKAGAPDAD